LIWFSFIRNGLLVDKSPWLWILIIICWVPPQVRPLLLWVGSARCSSWWVHFLRSLVQSFRYKSNINCSSWRGPLLRWWIWILRTSLWRHIRRRRIEISSQEDPPRWYSLFQEQSCRFNVSHHDTTDRCKWIFRKKRREWPWCEGRDRCYLVAAEDS